MAAVAPAESKGDEEKKAAKDQVDTTGGFRPIRWGCTTDVGGRAYQEDRMVCCPRYNRDINVEGVDKSIRRAFFAVYDGHGGSHCSEFLSKRFHTALASHSLIGENPKQALTEIWQRMDDEFYAHCQNEHRHRKTRNPQARFPQDGSTCTVMLLVGDTVYVANCGDSTCVYLKRKQPPVVLTEEHGTGNLEENKRVEAAGSELRQQYRKELAPFPFCCRLREVPAGKPRVYPGGLLVTRAFGDFHAKKPDIGGIEGTLICDHGAVQEFQLDDAMTDIVLASDGLWDAIPMNKFSRLLGEEYSDHDKNRSGFMRRVARGLAEAAVTSTYWDNHNADADNTTVIVLNLRADG